MKSAVSILAALGLLTAATPASAGEGREHHRSTAAAATTAQPLAEAVEGLQVPDSPVVDQDGRAGRFYTDLVKGRVVAINFIFTTCTTICPSMGASFFKLQELLGGRAGREVHLISVSVDPTTDTPQRLKAWSQKFGAGPGWTLVTGNREEITRLLKSLRVFTPNINDHTPLVLIGNDASHRWTRAFALAPPSRLAKLIDEMAAAPAEAATKESMP